MTILFVCTGNSCRSPMAESYCALAARKFGIDDIYVESAGTAVTGGSISRHARQILREQHIPLASQESCMITRENVRRADWILTMTESHLTTVYNMLPEARGKIKVLGHYLKPSRNISDPIGGTLEDYRECFRQIKVAVDAFLQARPHSQDEETS